MKKWRYDSDDASALRITLAVAFVFVVAVLFAFSFAGSPITTTSETNPSRGINPLAPPPPSCMDNTWQATSTSNPPSARAEHTAVWTGSEMIIWGGGNSNTGGRFNPLADSWTPTSTTAAPTGRNNHTAIWTGSEMIVWGGLFGFSLLNTGGRYNPLTNSWTPISTVNAPSARFHHIAVWTGSEMLVWGGESGVGCCPAGCCALNTGGRYDPVTDTWAPIATVGAPSARTLSSAVWTGTEMIVWGGGGGGSTGGRYNPTTDSWTFTSNTNVPSARLLHSAIWTGSEMIVWGGSYMNTGGRYNPVTDSWTATSTTNAPTGRSSHTAVWTGNEMIVWGGYNPSSMPAVFKTGGRYDPTTDSWNATNTANAPNGRFYHSAIWAGKEMIVWGGLEDNGMATPTSGANRQTQSSDSIDSQFVVATGSRYCAQVSATPTPIPTLTPVCNLTGSFDDIGTLSSTGWIMQNNSSPLGTTNWFQGNTQSFTSLSGAPNAYIAANYQNGDGVATISNWLLTPPLVMQNGSHFSFWTRTVTTVNFPDRLQVRLSTNGSSSDVGTTAPSVGDFTTLLFDINPTYTTTEYPIVWTYNSAFFGFLSPITGRIAFRYFVENGGPDGVNSDYIGIDNVQYECAPPTPTSPPGGTPSPTPTPTPTPTPDPTPTSPPFPDTTISGTVTLCAAATPVPLSAVTMTLTGTTSGSTTTSGAGSYQLTAMSTGNYTVTPTKAARAPSSAGISTVDVLATQNHVLARVLLTGCRLTAGDCHIPAGISTADVLAIQSFALGRTIPAQLGNVGKYSFTPASRSYPNLCCDIAAQDYTALIFGDVANPIADPRPGGPVSEMGDEAESNASVSLPDVMVNRASSDSTPSVTTTAIDSKNDLVAFQGDITFDERVISFAGEPVQNAGLTADNWNVAGNVLDGPGPIRTLRVSAYSTDLTPLSGAGVLFDLKIDKVNSGNAQLNWSTDPENAFYFIDADLHVQRPINSTPGRLRVRR